MRYLTVQQVGTVLGNFEERLSALMDALLDLESADAALTDPDVAANLADGRVDVQLTVEATDPAEAAVKALATLRAAIHAMGESTPGWETSNAILHVAPEADAECIAASA